MANLATIQAKINGGYGKAAAVLGSQWSRYRPNGPADPISPGTFMGTIQAQFANDSQFAFKDTSKPGQEFAWGLFDGTNTLPGDYLTDGASTLYIAAQRPLQPILCVQCNARLSFFRAAPPPATGTLGYGGRTPSTDTELLTEWPASVLLGPKGETPAARLPGDTRSAWWKVQMPAWPSVILHMGDTFSDSLTGRRFVVSGMELSETGWRLTALQAQT